MKELFLLIAAIAVPTSACERDLPDAHWAKAVGRELQDIQARAEPFPPVWSKNEEILHTSFDKAEIDTWASYYTHGDHIAGRNKSMAEETAKKWNANGISSSLVEYEVYLNYPESQSLVLNLANGSKHEAQLIEDVVAGDETTGAAGSIPAFHGYSKSGEVTAEYVYLGRGHKDDFNAAKAAGISVEGKIAVIKYGGPFRGTKVKNAEANGMVGVVIFTDPGDDGPQEAKGQAPYPDGPARHPSSIQRGSVADIAHYTGDPTTPGRASKPGVERETNPSVLPGIPSLPISQRDALPILQALDGHGSVLKRDGWRGGLNTTYSSGPAPGVALSLSNKMTDATTPIWNVIGIINGTNADETIIVGNHRDAWIIGGAADPNSGTAMFIEITKAFGELLKTGWKPKRNIVFASWDAEEYALVGSTEWVEDFAPWLADTAISYLNVDIAVNGGYPGASCTPELRGIAQSVMKKVIYGQRTLYDAWYDLYRFRPTDNGFGLLGSGSDYTAFLQYGIGALDFGMGPSSTDPVYMYHSNYDSYHWMKTMVDPDFSIHTTAGQFLALLTYHLADDALIPYDTVALGKGLMDSVTQVTSLTINCCGDASRTQKAVNLTQLVDAAHNFQSVAQNFATITSARDFQADDTKVQDANKRLKQVLRQFLNQTGLDGRPFYRNGMQAPNRDDGYKAQTFPGPVEALQDKDLPRAKEWDLFLTDALNKASALLTLT
ncbi:glutamate carboxypeptidase 2 [Massarina eburnea CBS 473.64]|uniref:Glutamate carboxypeptidase 2 n=1 Tax=Massarina eburnea CBS 473.64 TaxID=1395130 RepID=A0A6A6S893_9PLEO|nr:glutamate carboxypeptidase 2 [Massarina eburnea CBS 473.64]